MHRLAHDRHGSFHDGTSQYLSCHMLAVQPYGWWRRSRRLRWRRRRRAQAVDQAEEQGSLCKWKATLLQPCVR